MSPGKETQVRISSSRENAAIMVGAKEEHEGLLGNYSLLRMARSY